jgi:hypothetical protein
MGLIREPLDVDFVVEPHVYTEEDRRIFRAAVMESKARLKAEEKKWKFKPGRKKPAFV